MIKTTRNMEVYLDLHRLDYTKIKSTFLKEIVHKVTSREQLLEKFKNKQFFFQQKKETGIKKSCKNDRNLKIKLSTKENPEISTVR